MTKNDPHEKVRVWVSANCLLYCDFRLEKCIFTPTGPSASGISAAVEIKFPLIKR